MSPGRRIQITPARQREAIVAIVDSADFGVSAPEIAAALVGEKHFRLSPRTVRLRLQELVEAGRITATGDRRGRRYTRLRPPAHVAPITTPHFGSEAAEDHPSLSSSGRRALERIARPLHARQPTGYDRRFLEAYIPGESWYLSREQRLELARVGQSPESDRPAGTFARDIYARLLIDLAWASSRLEGNTYSRLDTENLIEFGQRAEGKDTREAQMILNHKRAIELLVDNAEQIGFDRLTLFGLHAALSENLLPNPRDEGRLRVHPVEIGGSTFVPLAIPQQIEELFALILSRATQIPDPFEQAFFVMVHLPYLQPFADVNKRTSRLAANIPMIRGNLCPLSFVDVPIDSYVNGTLAIYENQNVALLRDVFLWAYERSSRRYRIVRESLGDPDPLRLRYREQLREMVRDTVLSMQAPTLGVMREHARKAQVPDTDIEAVSALGLELLVSLGEGAAARNRIRPSEYAAWRAHFAVR